MQFNYSISHTGELVSPAVTTKLKSYQAEVYYLNTVNKSIATGTIVRLTRHNLFTFRLASLNLYTITLLT